MWRWINYTLLWLWWNYPSLTNMSWPASPTFKTILSIPRYNLSAHTFATHTLPLHWISSIINFLASNSAVTHDLLILKQINQTILNLEWQLDEQHCLAAWWFSILLAHHSASWIPQYIHNIKQPDCRQYHIWWQQLTPHPRHRSQPIIVHGSSSKSKSSSSSSSSSVWEWYRQMPSYPHCPSATLVASTSTLIVSFPRMTTWSDQVLAQTWFEVNALDYLCRLWTAPEEQWWGMVEFPIVVESPEAEETIFQQYYHWFINEGCDWGCTGCNRLRGGYCYDSFTLLFLSSSFAWLLIHNCALLQQCMY